MTDKILQDRELLELAAKAYGVTLDYLRGSDAYYYDDPDTGRERWSPLGDDGQAFRLAVKLEMRIATHCNQKMAMASDIHMRVPAQVVPWGGDQESAVRQSIVLLAAAIGATP